MSIYKQQEQVLQLEIKTEDRQLSDKLRELKKQVMQISHDCFVLLSWLRREVSKTIGPFCK